MSDLGALPDVGRPETGINNSWANDINARGDIVNTAGDVTGVASTGAVIWTVK